MAWCTGNLDVGHSGDSLSDGHLMEPRGVIVMGNVNSFSRRFRHLILQETDPFSGPAAVTFGHVNGEGHNRSPRGVAAVPRSIRKDQRLFHPATVHLRVRRPHRSVVNLTQEAARSDAICGHSITFSCDAISIGDACWLRDVEVAVFPGHTPADSRTQRFATNRTLHLFVRAAPAGAEPLRQGVDAVSMGLVTPPA
jgi:hypothetical protein